MAVSATVQGGKERRKGAYGAVDGRSADGRLLRRVRDELTVHLGPRPSAVQLSLVHRAAWLTLHLSRLDAAMAKGGISSDHASRQYLAWSNSLSKTLRHLGLKGAAQSAPNLREHLARRAAGATS